MDSVSEKASWTRGEDEPRGFSDTGETDAQLLRGRSVWSTIDADVTLTAIFVPRFLVP